MVTGGDDRSESSSYNDAKSSDKSESQLRKGKMFS
jgi:hypothetical protein